MKRKVKEVVSLALAAGLVVGLIAGCSTGKESGSTEGKKQVTLTFGSHQSGLPTSGIVQELAKDFETETGIKIDFQISPDAQWRDLIKVKLDSGEAPDIICVDTPIGLASSLHMDQYCPELTDQPWVSRIEKTTLASVSVKDKVYGITFPGAKMYFYLYNKDIFKKLGLSVPTTYKEFLSVCQTLKEAGYTPIYEATTNGWHQVLPLFETGGLWLNQDPDMYEKLNENKIDLDGIPSLLNIIKQLDECAKAGYFGDDYLSNAWENAKEAMATERCVMTVAELGFRGQIEKEYPNFKATEKLGAFVMPWGDNQEIGVNPASNAYFINKDSKYIEEAKQFFDFLARPENLQKRLDGQPELSALCWPEITSKYTKEDQAFLDSLKRQMLCRLRLIILTASGWM